MQSLPLNKPGPMLVCDAIVRLVAAQTQKGVKCCLAAMVAANIGRCMSHNAHLVARWFWRGGALNRGGTLFLRLFAGGFVARGARPERRSVICTE